LGPLFALLNIIPVRSQREVVIMQPSKMVLKYDLRMDQRIDFCKILELLIPSIWLSNAVLIRNHVLSSIGFLHD